MSRCCACSLRSCWPTPLPPPRLPLPRPPRPPPPRRPWNSTRSATQVPGAEVDREALRSRNARRPARNPARTLPDRKAVHHGHPAQSRVVPPGEAPSPAPWPPTRTGLRCRMLPTESGSPRSSCTVPRSSAWGGAVTRAVASDCGRRCAEAGAATATQSTAARESVVRWRIMDTGFSSSGSGFHVEARAVSYRLAGDRIRSM